MAGQRTDRRVRSAGALKRRGLLAGAAALLAGGLAKLGTTQRVQAAHDSSADQTVLHADEQNTTSGTTTIFRSGGAGVTTLQVYNSASGGVAVVAQSTGTGSSGAGLYGVNNTAASGDFTNTVGGVGVFGFNNNTEPTARGIGVWGQILSATGVGVRGENRADVTGAVGVQGVSQNTDTGALLRGIGVQGLSGAGTGVRGASTSSFGVYGVSQSGAGVFGGSNTGLGVYANSNEDTGVFSTAPRKAVWGRTPSGIGVFGQATQASAQAVSYGVYGAAPVPGWAGYFEGNIFVTGRVFTASGGVVNAAQAADGSQRALYSLDAAEPLVEDVGEGTLVGGQARVALDPELVAVADTEQYHIFVTEVGDAGGLYVRRQDAGGFEVRSRTANGIGSFHYRVVARRRGAAGKRLERLERPRGLSARDLEPPKLPDPVRGEPEQPAPRPPGRAASPDAR